MQEDIIYITINHLDDFNKTYAFRVGDRIFLKKDPDNCYDDEAIVTYDERCCKCGYVANSVHSVIRGTYSAGRIYDRFRKEAQCTVRFISEEALIAEVDLTLTE